MYVYSDFILFERSHVSYLIILKQDIQGKYERQISKCLITFILCYINIFTRNDFKQVTIVSVSTMMTAKDASLVKYIIAFYFLL